REPGLRGDLGDAGPVITAPGEHPGGRAQEGGLGLLRGHAGFAPHENHCTGEGVAWGSMAYLDRDGVSIYYEVHGPTEPVEPSRAPLLLSHGYSATAD